MDQWHKEPTAERKEPNYDRYLCEAHRHEADSVHVSQSYIAWDAVWDLVKNILAAIGAYALVGTAISLLFGIPWPVILGVTFIGGFALLMIGAALASITVAHG